MEELMTAFKKKFGEDIGLIIYGDMSGRVFKDDERIDHAQDYETCLFSFDDINNLTVKNIEENQTINLDN